MPIERIEPDICAALFVDGEENAFHRGVFLFQLLKNVLCLPPIFRLAGLPVRCEAHAVTDVVIRLEERLDVFSELPDRVIVIADLRHALRAHEGRIDRALIEQKVTDVVMGRVFLWSIPVLICDMIERSACNIISVKRSPLLLTLAALVLCPSGAPLIPDVKVDALVLQCHADLQPFVIIAIRRDVLQHIQINHSASTSSIRPLPKRKFSYWHRRRSSPPRHSRTTTAF